LYYFLANSAEGERERKKEKSKGQQKENKTKQSFDSVANLSSF
jgi:hypothetical protein